MNCRAKKILSVNLAGLGLGLAALTASAQTADVFGGLPLYFEANGGQTGAAEAFVAHARDGQFSILPDGAQIVLRGNARAESCPVRMQFVGANLSAQMRGDAELPGKINYLVGNNPARWRTGVPTFAKVRVEEIYRGINVVYYGNQRRLEYDFVVAPGANPNMMAIRFTGVKKISVSGDGELVLDLGDGEIRQPKPLIYQIANGARKEIGGGYKILDARTVTFALGQYDSTLPLTIDPVLSFSTYFGGNSGDTAWTVAVSTNDDSIYLAGQTFSTRSAGNSMFSTAGAFQTNFAGGGLTGDAFVAKLDNSGQNLIYLTYLGGSADDSILSMAVDGAGDAFVTGFTDSSNFPTANAIFPKIGGVFSGAFGSFPADGFVAELDSGGSNLIYSTFLGGSGMDDGTGIAVDSAGNAYVTGLTFSTNFPVTNAIQDHLACTNSVFFNANAFVTEIAAGGSNLVFSTYFGGTNFDQANGIAVDGSGAIYITGFTASTNFPTLNPLPGFSKLNGATNFTAVNDAFVTKFAPFNGSLSLVYSTFLGGTNDDIGRHIACDAAGNAFVTGSSASTNFPNTTTNIPGLFSFVATNNAITIATNAFLTEINPDGTAIIYSAMMGGSGVDIGYGVAVDAAGDAFVAGATSSQQFPVTNTAGIFNTNNSGLSDVFVTAFSANASALLYSARFGGENNDFGYGIALDSMTNAFVVGQTLSSRFPTRDAVQSRLAGGSDALIAGIILNPLPPQITTQPTNQLVTSGTVSFSVAATGTPPLSYQWQLNGTNLVNGANISGATNTGVLTNSVLTIFSAQTNDAGNYTVIVTNFAGSVTSQIATLTVGAPIITQQPTNQTVGVGSTVTFFVDGTALQPITFQWLKDGVDLTDGTNASGSVISGATNNNLTISNVQTNDDGGYQLIVTNNFGSATSQVATLTVLASPAFTSIVAANDGSGGFILNGGGGTNNGTFFVLTSTNLATPLGQWTPIATNQFDANGLFTFTNVPPADTPQQFYILQTQ